MIEWPWLTLMVLNFMQLGMVAYLVDHNYYHDRKSHVREVINEICVLALIYIFIGLSDFVQGVDARIWTGDQLILLASGLMTFNLVYTALFSIA